MERAGAAVVAIEPPLHTLWDIVPRPGFDREVHKTRSRVHLERVRNSFWYAHQSIDSAVELYEADSYNLPNELGRFDIGVLAAVLLHSSAPIKMMESVARLVDSTMIVTEPFVEDLGTKPVCALLPSPANNIVDAWWNFTPQFVATYLNLLGFARITTLLHQQIYRGSDRPFPMFTVVGKR